MYIYLDLSLSDSLTLCLSVSLSLCLSLSLPLSLSLSLFLSLSLSGLIPLSFSSSPLVWPSYHVPVSIYIYIYIWTRLSVSLSFWSCATLSWLVLASGGWMFPAISARISGWLYLGDFPDLLKFCIAAGVLLRSHYSIMNIIVIKMSHDHFGERLRGNTIRGNRPERFWDGNLPLRGSLRWSQRVFRGFQRLSEVFRGILRFERSLEVFRGPLRAPLRAPLRVPFSFQSCRSCCP